jgi:HEAT repeat protein
MLKSKINYTLIIALLLAFAMQSFGQTVVPATRQQVDKLIAVLKSDAPHKEKADACRLLAIVGTKDAIAPLAALLGDEKLSHMARYGLEPIPDPAVDEALRDALGKLKGRPLVGVIGSIGVRRDVKAVRPLAKMLRSPDTQVAQAAARALGKIGDQPATRALQRALPNVSAANQLAFCEGLFRCAEALIAQGHQDQAIEIYDQLRELDAPHQVRGGALRGAILARGSVGKMRRRAGETIRQYILRRNDGVSLLMEHLRSDDYIMFSAAVQTAQELPGVEVTQALTAELNQLPPDNQILVLQTLGKRADPQALGSLFALAMNSKTKSVRIAAIRALPDIGDPSSAGVLERLLDDADSEISKEAQEALAALPGQKADEAVMAMLNSSQTSRRLTALELIGRRRMTTSIPALLKAASDADPRVRPAALRKIGELGGPAELPALLDLLTRFRRSQDLDAARQALSAVCAKADDMESCAEKLTSLLSEARPEQKSTLLRVLSTIGGTSALRAVRAAVNDPDAQVHTAAIRALGAWKTADAAPDLLALAKTASNPNDKTLCLRGYLGLAARPDLPVNQRLSMCRQVAGLIQRNAEKKLLLSALGSISSPDAIVLIIPYLDDPATREEAGMATVAIAERLLRGRNVSKFAPKLIEPLEKVVQVTANADLARRAKALLQRAQGRGGRR